MHSSHAVHLFLALKTDKGAPRKTRDFSSLLDLIVSFTMLFCDSAC
jgi:hypothetical protein